MAKKIKNLSVPSIVNTILTSDRDKITQLLEEQCLQAVNSDIYPDGTRNSVIVAMIKEVAKNGNTTELILASQFIALSILGMSTLSRNYVNSIGQGLQILRLSQVSLETLERYRNSQKQDLNQDNAISINDKKVEYKA